MHIQDDAVRNWDTNSQSAYLPKVSRSLCWMDNPAPGVQGRISLSEVFHTAPKLQTVLRKRQASDLLNLLKSSSRTEPTIVDGDLIKIG